MTSATSMLPHKTCLGCWDSVPLAVSAAASTFYLGWICARCLAADADDGLLDVISVHRMQEEAQMDCLSEEYWTSLEAAKWE